MKNRMFSALVFKLRQCRLVRVAFVLLLVSVFAQPSAAQVSFNPVPLSFPYPNPGFLATGDFNNDGNLDVVGPSGLKLGAGNGMLGNTTALPNLGANPYEMTTGDFNGDSNLDLVVSDNQSGFVRVLLGDGAGHFGTAIASPNRTSRYLAVAYFNGDGKQDVVTLDTNNIYASVLLGNGNGSFGPRTDYSNSGPNPNPNYPAPLTYGPSSVATGDLDGDGDADIVFGNQGGGVAIMINTGNGLFNAPANITASNVLFGGIGWVKLGDLNQDNRLDLLTFAGTKPSHILLLLGNGNGTFGAPTAIPVIAAAFNPTDNFGYCLQGWDPVLQIAPDCAIYFALADLDQDSRLDLVVPHAWDSGRISFLRGNGDGTFAAPTTYSFPNYTWEPGYTVMGDLNNDGRPDLVTTRWRQHELTVLTNTTVVSQPPTITVPGNMTVEGNTLGGATVAFTVTAARSSGQPLTPSCVPASGAFFALGTTTVNCSATDPVGTASASFTVTVVDTIAPALAVPANQTLEATSAAGAIATFVASATDAVSPVAITYSQNPGTFFALGTTTVTVTAKDAAGNTSTGSFTIAVADTTAPVIASVTPSQGSLWPPNHQMVGITVSAVVTDVVGVTSLKIINVTSSEPDNGLGDGDTAGDTLITGPLSVNLRAERSGKGNGRTYTITLEARDASGNVSMKTCTVVVPKSQGK